MVYTLQDRKSWPVTTGVYKLTFINSTSNKVYIGSSASIRKGSYYGIRTRWGKHADLLKLGIHYSKKLQYAYNKYGGENLTFEIIDSCDGGNIIEMETFYITKYDSCNNGYNSRPTAESNVGYKVPKSIIEKTNITKRKKREPYEIDVLKLYKETKNALGVSRELGLSHSVVLKILKDYNIIPKNGDYKRKNVYAYMLDGCFVGIWKDARSCADALNLKSICSISHVAMGKNISYKGYFFSYEKKTKREIVDYIKTRICESRQKMSNPDKLILRNIGQYDMSGNLIKVWETSTEIKKYFDMFNFSPISAVFAGTKKHYKGFFWKKE